MKDERVKEDSQLTDEQRKLFVTHLEKFGKDTVCPVCGHEHFNVGGRLISAPGAIHDGKLTLNISYPLAFVTCDNCYYVMSFMAAPIGLLGEVEEKKTD